MRTQRTVSTSPLEEPHVAVPVKLAAAWTSFVLLYVYTDILSFYMPGVIDDIRAGMPGLKPKGPVHAEPDRARAIFEAIGGAHQGDVVLIAGKGHEDYQEVAGERLPFSDVAVAEKALAAWT